MAFTTPRVVTTAPVPHRPGRLRFCSWSCHDGYKTDLRYGAFTGSYAAGECDYCGHPVPINAQLRAEREKAGA